jgi:DNA polymerase-1
MLEQKNKLFLIDAMALIYRAHFAFIRNPRINSKGLNTSAIFGFTNSLLELLEKQNPTHIAVAFDSYEPTIRHDDFSDYKANRDKQPEDISLSLPYIKKLLSAFNIPVLELAGYEADDIIGTIAHQVSEKDYEVYMFTPDKDFAQLVKENVFLFKPSRMGKPNEVWDIDKVKEEFGIKRVDQVVEIQGLMGDAVDNIPGVPGIGPKTAKQLIGEYDNIENLLANTDQLKGKVKENLETYADQARLSKQLATLLTDAPVDFCEEDFRKTDYDAKAIEELFAELEFRNLSKRLLGKDVVTDKKEESVLTDESSANPNHTSFSDINAQYRLINDESDAALIADHISGLKRFALHIELSSPDPYAARIKSLTIAVQKNEAFYIKLPLKEEESALILKHFKSVFENKDIIKISHSIKPLIICMKRYNLFIKNKLFDNQLAHYIIDSESRHDLELLAEKYLDYTMLNHAELSTELLSNYYCEKADINLQLFEVFEKHLVENSFQPLFYDLEAPMQETLASMEYEGVKIETTVLKKLSKDLESDLLNLEKNIHQETGVPFNINSPAQLGHVLFDILKLDPNARKTRKTKQYSTSEEVLRKLAPKHKLVKQVLDFRGVQKLKSTYVDALPELVNEKTGKIHTTYEQTVAATGRLSSKNPNLQNIPIRTERGRFVREAFVPTDSNHVLLAADYSQIELRVIAHMSNDESMIEAFRQKQDIHTSTAAKVFGVGTADVDADMRRKAKEVNFGIIYGISAWGLAQRLDIPRKEGSEIIEQYFTQFPSIQNYIEDCQEFARKHGYAETLFKRRRYLRDINSRSAMQRSFAERNAVNAPIQGSAADIIKMAMVNISKELQEKKLQSKMILQVHDELIFDVLKEEQQEIQAIVVDKMENAVELKVPLTVDVGIGNNWLEAH